MYRHFTYLCASDTVIYLLICLQVVTVGQYQKFQEVKKYIKLHHSILGLMLRHLTNT